MEHAWCDCVEHDERSVSAQWRGATGSCLCNACYHAWLALPTDEYGERPDDAECSACGE